MNFKVFFRIDSEGSNKMLNCLMYKMCYYRFGQVYTEGGEIYTIINNKTLFFENRTPTWI